MYKVEVLADSEGLFKIKSKDYAFVIDIKGRGVTPPDALLASLGSCIGVYVRKYLEGAKITAGEFLIMVEADLSQDTLHCFKEIKVSLDLKGILIDERRKLAILDFIKNCPVHNTLKTNPKIEVSIL